MAVVTPTSSPTESAAAPPTEPLQDWLPAGASHDEIHARLLALSGAAEANRAAAGSPTFDEHGSLHVGDTSVAVPVLERAVAAMLVDHFEQPVAAIDLTYASNSGSHGALHGRLCQLRQLVNILGLEIAPVSDESYVLRRCG